MISKTETDTNDVSYGSSCGDWGGFSDSWTCFSGRCLSIKRLLLVERESAMDR